MNRLKVQEIDYRLKDEYNNPIPRKDYFAFISWFDRRLIENGEDEFPLNNENQRVKWPFIKYNGGRKREFDLIVETLLKHDIIWRSCYQFGPKRQHCRMYRYTEDFLDSFDLCLDSIEVDVNNKIKDKIHSNDVYNNKQYELLTSQRFTINVKLAREWVLDAHKNNQISKLKAGLYFDMIDNIHLKNIYLTIGKKIDRVYSSFTNIKSELRQFCKIDNESLQSIDIKSCHAYFLVNKLKKMNKDNDTDLDVLYSIVSKHDIYVYILEQLNIPVTYDNRELIKKDFYHYLYKGNSGKPTKSQLIIMKNFPYSYELIKELNNELERNSSSLAIYLQNLEADVFIPICNRFVERGCLSVHDSLYFKSELRGEIEKELKKSLNKHGFFDFTLKLK